MPFPASITCITSFKRSNHWTPFVLCLASHCPVEEMLHGNEAPAPPRNENLHTSEVYRPFGFCVTLVSSPQEGPCGGLIKEIIHRGPVRIPNFVFVESYSFISDQSFNAGGKRNRNCTFSFHLESQG